MACRRRPHHAGNAKRIGEPEQVVGLDGGGERALVNPERGLGEPAAHLRLAPLRHAAFGDATTSSTE